MLINGFLVLVVALLIARTVTNLILDGLNRSHVRRNAGDVPASYRDQITAEEYQKSVDYTRARSLFGSFEQVYGAIVLGVFLFSGLLPLFFRWGEGMIGAGIWSHALILFGIGFVMALPSVPLDWWETFNLEERFGFNKTTPKLWVIDKLKGVIVNLVLLYPLVCLLLWLVRMPLWWVWGFVVVLVFQIVMMVAYPMFIMPLFNKFTPLPEGELRDRLMSLSERTGFMASTILVMDGSKRSGHSNAFFTGFGRFRRIVLYDTLIEQMDPEELEAVLAHEIGHYKLGHIPKMLVISSVFTFLAFAVIGWLARAPWFVESFGFIYSPESLAPALLLFALLSGLFTFWLTPFLAMWSRRHEYEADAFAKRALQNDPNPLIRALRKLHKKNLSNLTPHPLYSAFHYSHPSLVERERSLLEA